MQVFGTHRLQQKGVLIELAVAAEIRRQGALEPQLVGSRKIEIGIILRLFQSKGSLFI